MATGKSLIKWASCFPKWPFPGAGVAEGTDRQGCGMESCTSSLFVHKLHVFAKWRKWCPFEWWEVTDNEAMHIPKPSSFFLFQIYRYWCKILPFCIFRYLIFTITWVHKNMRRLHRYSWILCNPMYYQGRNIDVVTHASCCCNPSWQSSEVYTQGSQIKNVCICLHGEDI